MRHAYIYLLQSGEYINTNIYKIGKTVQKSDDTRNLNRIKSYPPGTIVYNLYHINNPDHINSVENEIIVFFRSKYRLATGREWFEGNVIDMKLDIDTIVNKYNQIPYHSNFNNNNMEDIDPPSYISMYPASATLPATEASLDDAIIEINNQIRELNNNMIDIHNQINDTPSYPPETLNNEYNVVNDNNNKCKRISAVVCLVISIIVIIIIITSN